MNPILIVDDEAAIAMLVRRILTEAGYRCQAVTDRGLETVSLIRISNTVFPSTL